MLREGREGAADVLVQSYVCSKAHHTVYAAKTGHVKLYKSL